MTVYLSVREGQVYALLCTGMQAKQIAEKLNWGTKYSSIYGIIGRLIQMQAVEKIKGKTTSYRGLLDRYEVVADDQELYKIRREMLQNIEPFQRIEVTAAMRAQILAFYETATRSKLAEMLGVPRYVINRELIRMGLDRKE